MQSITNKRLKDDETFEVITNKGIAAPFLSETYIGIINDDIGTDEMNFLLLQDIAEDQHMLIEDIDVIRHLILENLDL